MKTFITAILLSCLIASTTPPSVMAATVEEEEIELKMREIAKTLRCAVCQSESVWESNAGLARQMREVIRERLAQGQSPEEIRAYFLSRYGDYILLAPRKSGLNWLLWAGPFVLLAVGGFWLYRTLLRWVARSAATEREELLPINDRLRQRVEEELRSRED
jgi:cytochrome c-type biogenesis protein CcmH